MIEVFILGLVFVFGVLPLIGEALNAGKSTDYKANLMVGFVGVTVVNVILIVMILIIVSFYNIFLGGTSIIELIKLIGE